MVLGPRLRGYAVKQFIEYFVYVDNTFTIQTDEELSEAQIVEQMVDILRNIEPEDLTLQIERDD